MTGDASTPRRARAPFGLRTKIVGMLGAILLLFSVAFIAYAWHDQGTRLESEMLERSRTIATEMDAVWDFVSINQYPINHHSDGTYDFKGLHCAIAGKAVAMMFSKNTDYMIRFTNINPRNIYNEPDAYEREALETFASDPATTEIYGYAMRDGRQVFRYVRTMTVSQSCLSCHGEPAGEIDETGYPKEGKRVGDLAGAVSVTVPTQTYLDAMRADVLRNVLMFVGLLACVLAIIYVVLSRMVTTPLRTLNESIAAFMTSGEGRPATRDAAASRARAVMERAYATSEMDGLFAQFDAMAHRLGDLYASLEAQVTNRTAELSEANAELERQRAHVEEINGRLREEVRYKSDFLAIVSHELRTPLTSILAFAELLDESIGTDECEAREELEEIQKNGAVLLEMVDNVLETARIQAGSERLNLELLDLSDLVGYVESTNAAVAIRKGVLLATAVDARVPLVTSDWEKLRRILVNLVSNAIKFTPRGGQVVVEARLDPRPDWVQLRVLDTGIGIPADKQRLIFERFTQENMTTVRRYGGSGLGLSLVKELTAMLGGQVRVTSEVGRGSMFVVCIPVSPPGGEAADDLGDVIQVVRAEDADDDKRGDAHDDNCGRDGRG
ncbi:DUF3365 domain-containing protein [bacterium]|nr:DUF3365 domain-containing protein [bacterium]